jgi:hypothetical protein
VEPFDDAVNYLVDATNVSTSDSSACGERSRLPFHVTSSDWQESDQVLAGIISDFGSPTGAVPFAGRGEFDGVMTGAFRAPRVEGLFTGEDLRAFDTLWGDGSAQITVENRYVTVKDGAVRAGDSEIRADGLFSLGYPREDRGEEPEHEESGGLPTHDPPRLIENDYHFNPAGNLQAAAPL